MAEEPNEDLSMDDILSSIRNILMEDNAAQQSVPQPAPQTEKKAEPVSAPAAELPPAINTADELNTADQDDELSAEALLGLGDNAQASDAPEDDVFNLSPSMIVDEALDEPVLSNPADNEPEISEDDILDLSRLAAPSADELTGETAPAAMPVAEPEPQTPSMQAPLASQVLAEEDAFPAEPPVSEEPEVTVDDVMNLSSLVEEPVLPSEPEYGSSDSVYPHTEAEPVAAVPEFGLPDDLPQETADFSIRDEELSAETAPASEEFREEGEGSVAVPPLDFELPQIDVDAEPIYEPEHSAAPEIDPSRVMASMPQSEELPAEPEEESVIDDATLNEILDFHAQVEETKPTEPEYNESPSSEPEAVEPADNIQDVPSEPVIETVEAERETKTPVEAPAAPSEDAADVSANIISNFAKLFAEKKAAELPQTADVSETESRPEPVKSASPSISELVREAVVRQVTQQMDVNFESYAREAVAAQTQAWLDANLPAIVEAVVSKEIERVMAKVGS